MSNTFGKFFSVTTFGESHGPAIGCVVDGCPAGFSLTEADIQTELDKRKPGQSRNTSQRREGDQVQILSGVFEGKTTGSPITLLIRNEDARARDYEPLKEVFRPGHGDYVYFKKYGHRDHRGGGRASARETAARVAAGAIAKKFLFEKNDIRIKAYLAQVGDLLMEKDQEKALEQLITALREEGDSIGARVNIEVSNVPVGLGEPIYDKLDADLAKALMSINAVKGVEIGDGFKVVQQKGSQHRDEMTQTGFKSNHAGGILAGISTGQNILLSIALKPTSSIRKPADTIDIYGNNAQVVTMGRHDPCVGIRAVPVAEAMVALVVMDHWLCMFGQKGIKG